MKTLNYIWVLLAGIISFAACVKEDRSDCPPDDGTKGINERILHFKTWPKKYVFEDHVQSVHLYIYDVEENGTLIESAEVSRDFLVSNNYQVNLDDLFELTDKNHHLIAIMNLCDEYEIVGEETLLNFMASFVTTNADSIYHKIADVFLGNIDITPLTKTTVRDTVDLYKLTNHIYVTVRFDGYTLPADHDIDAYISGTNSRYNYKREAVGATSLMYTPHTKIIEPPTFNFNITTGKLWIGDDLKLGIEEYGSDGKIYRDVSMVLTQEIAKLKDNDGNYLYDTNEKLMQEDEFYLEIVLDADFSIIQMTINNWFAVRPGVDL